MRVDADRARDAWARATCSSRTVESSGLPGGISPSFGGVGEEATAREQRVDRDRTGTDDVCVVTDTSSHINKSEVLEGAGEDADRS